jgi:uncharacterized membrane protein
MRAALIKMQKEYLVELEDAVVVQGPEGQDAARSGRQPHGRRATPDKVLAGLAQFAGKGKVFQPSLSKDDEAALREVLEAATGA